MTVAFDNPPQARLVVLGASNLTRGLSVVVETARQLVGTPLAIFGALGQGRSYGMRSSIGFGARAVPGILECGLWKALESTSPAHGRDPNVPPTLALITDIGNDIMYGVAPRQIAGWVEQCVERLHQQASTIAMTSLPIDKIRAVRRWQYAIVKAIMFPTRNLTFVDAIDRATELQELLLDLAQRRGVTVITPHSAWYGFDPIHVRFQHWNLAWAHILGGCAAHTGEPPCAKPSLTRWMRVRTHMPERYWLFGLPCRARQPARIMRDGTRLWLY